MQCICDLEIRHYLLITTTIELFYNVCIFFLRLASIHTGLQLYNTLPGYLKEMPPSKFKSQLQDLLHKNSFYSVKEFNEYFQNKDEAKTTREICLHV